MAIAVSNSSASVAPQATSSVRQTQQQPVVQAPVQTPPAAPAAKPVGSLGHNINTKA